MEQAFAEDLDRGRARLATGRRATLRAAAMINGAASHSVEFDDIYRDAGYFRPEDTETLVDFALSENPQLRFQFKPQEGGELQATVIDSKDLTFTQTVAVKGGALASSK